LSSKPEKGKEQNMKVALVMPSITLEECCNKTMARITGSFPPIGLLSIGTVLKNEGNEVIVLDGSIEPSNNIIGKIERFKPDIVGITALTLMWPKVRLLSRKLKEKRPHLNIIVGGVHTTIIREKALSELPSVDAIAWGEGEYSMLEYVKNLSRLDSSGPISGIAFRRKDGSLVIGSDRQPVKSLDSLPIPDRNLVPVTKYVGAIEQYKKLPATSMITSRGCPFKCIFCLPGLLGDGVRYRSVDKVIEELKYLINEFGIRDIAFWDDTFTLNKKRVYAVCEGIIREKLNFTWSAQTRADCVTPALLGMMARAGCWKVYYGVESLVQKNLDTLKKGQTVEQIFDAVRWTKKAGMEIEASFIFGIPGQTFQEGLQTIRLAKKLNPDYAKFLCLCPYGKLRKEAKKYGNLITKNERDYGRSVITFVPFSMTKDELQKLYYTAYRQFYLRPAIIYKRLKKVLNPLDFRKSIKGLSVLGSFLKQQMAGKLKKTCYTTVSVDSENREQVSS